MSRESLSRGRDSGFWGQSQARPQAFSGNGDRKEGSSAGLCLCSCCPPGTPLFSDAASGSPIPAFRIDEVFLQISEHLSMNTGETQEQTLHKGEVRMSVNLL